MIQRHLPKVGVATAVLVMSLTTANAAGADTGTSKPTETRGKVCGHMCPQQKLVSVGSYVFKGTTRPSREGQRVTFSYKRPGGQWHPFHARFDGNPFSTRNDKPSDRIDGNHGWKINFVPLTTGRYVVRAVFPAQDGLERSVLRKRVFVVGEGRHLAK